jgi:aspartokinase-like uncharacterized kinase
MAARALTRRDEQNEIHVLKLGGSLLDLPDVTQRIEALRATLETSRVLMIAGGGAAADRVRQFNQNVGFDETTGHWLAIRAMQFHAYLLAAALPESTLVTALDQCEATWRAGRMAIVAPLAWLDAEEAAGRGVPHRWAFTSDSIAAYAARGLNASRFTLLKSTCPTSSCTLPQAADRGIVDPCLAEAAASLPYVSLVNLRDDAMPACRLQNDHCGANA